MNVPLYHSHPQYTHYAAWAVYTSQVLCDSRRLRATRQCD